MRGGYPFSVSRCRNLAKNGRLLLAVAMICLSATFFGSTSGQATTRVPQLTLQKGESYFRVHGVQRFIFMRNLAGYLPEQYERLLDMAKGSGTTLVRIQLDSMGNGYAKDGRLDEVWARNWERVFDRAFANGIAVLPVFAGWFDWNNGIPDYGYSTWKSNPLNSANGGPALTPADLFESGSTTRRLWLNWVQTLVTRWQGRTNIAAWEVLSEMNIATGADERSSVKLAEEAASIIRDADLRRRPVTASLAEVGEWPTFYRSGAVDFINFHPYPSSGQLDTFIIQSVQAYIAKYNKPVLVGESGLSALPPNAGASTLTTAPNARTGVRHAVWASIVSGAMNGRALYWEDGFAVFFPNLDWPFLEGNRDLEWPAARFTDGVDFTGLRPLTARYSKGITGAAVGHAKMIIGWFRDAGCEPPEWPLRVVSKQHVAITMPPGSAAAWAVDLYHTDTGTDKIASIQVSRKGNSCTINLPDFRDDIVFKMYPRSN